jgi:single-stranded-DNA-specific exonuclease
MKFRWCVAPSLPLLAGQLAKQLNLSPLVAQCLVNRGLSEPEPIGNFLDPKLKQLCDPFLLPDMAVAVERLFQARERGEALVIFGDYDVDGVTSTALLAEALPALGWEVHAYLPRRMEEGYGLSREGVENCLQKYPVTLLLAVDCGSTSFERVADLKNRGVEVVILDHHQISDPAPQAVALVNPQRQKSLTADAEEKTSAGSSARHGLELCSVGLAFKLVHALVKRGRESGLKEAADYDLRPLLDLVALGTIADMVPLTGENRILVSAGLDRLNRTKRPGLLALQQVAKSGTPLGVYEVGFQLAPRLNAAGRLETAEAALELLRARDLAEARPLAEQLDCCNRERQQLERSTVEEVMGSLKASFNAENHFAIVEGRAPWHIGVLGIVASRVLQQFYRPTIIVGGEGVEWRGSGRSIAGFDLAAALRECGDLLVRHGGHAMAAGLTIAVTNLEAFRERFNEVARRKIKPENLQPALQLDGEVGLEKINFESLTALERLRPMGQGNPSVQFFARNLTHQKPLQRMGAEKQHVKLWVTDGTTSHETVWWCAGNESLPVGRFDVAFAPKIETYKGRQGIQLKMLDWRASV